jgi:hypothetical protein
VLASNLGPLVGQTTNFLEDAAQGTAVYRASLAMQPSARPFEPAPSGGQHMADNVQLTGVAASIDHIVM